MTLSFLSFHLTPSRMFPRLLASQEPSYPTADTNVLPYSLPDPLVDPKIWDTSPLMASHHVPLMSYTGSPPPIPDILNTTSPRT